MNFWRIAFFVSLFCGGVCNIANGTDRTEVWYRVGLSPTLSMFKPHQFYMNNLLAYPGFGANFRVEISPKKALNQFVFGLEYLNETVKFQSYYFSEGGVAHYNKVFDYTHTVNFNQLYVPLLIKQPLRRKEHEQLRSLYLLGGWAWRQLLYTRASIKEKITGEKVWSGQPSMTAQRSFLGKTGSSAIIAGIGIELRTRPKHNAFTAELLYRHNLSRMTYNADDADYFISLKNRSLSLVLGFEF
jgi:hypothetical protein